MGKGLKDIHVSYVGSHENSDKIPQWMKANGGAFSREINQNVTHLIASESAFNKDVEAVRKARDWGVRIVTYDWLEDSLMAKPCRPLRVGPYLWDRIGKEKTEKFDGKNGKRGRKPGQKNSSQRKREVDTTKDGRVLPSDMEHRGHHLYVEETTYNATLVRAYISKSRIFRETFNVTLYESNNTPHTYVTLVKYNRYRSSREDILAPCGSTLEFAKSTFENFFTVKTGLEWKDRFDESKVPISGTMDDGVPIKPEGGWFSYERPTGIMSSLNADAERGL
ncbi:anthranilate synthase / indole-3-glycerol phosphate synthase / phosphoribosylanthranilate isomerase [Talaromyces islandicus]|uniref:Anthranilate synthase / indole-3-glycerol phosphate synthase / phosphoribosylanthranilate isomerase n=1 Tax=Talaromyces islandicus TaxID=28573 RepID=A0A0U1M239_TALIS|nr:anthranilate synthase / indole-3-glycerol phosphate synthase / phosphoribosylanthranilate isomerase [Talaromyces islandicus]